MMKTKKWGECEFFVCDAYSFYILLFLFFVFTFVCVLRYLNFVDILLLPSLLIVGLDIFVDQLLVLL